jgi:hypothetical protein
MVLGIIAGGAAADTPRSVLLAPERTSLLDGHVTLRLVEGMAVSDDDRVAVLDWGGTEFELVASMTREGSGDSRELLAADRELGSARVEKLAPARSGAAYGGAPVMPRLSNERALVYVAAAAGPHGYTLVLRFYVSADGLDDAPAWTGIARAVASTLEVRVGAAPMRPAPPAPLPRSQGPAPRHISTRYGGCDIVDGELDTHPVAPSEVTYEPGRFRGDLAYWSVWSDRAGQHAETIFGAAHRGQVHVICHAGSSAELASQRAMVEGSSP